MKSFTKNNFLRCMIIFASFLMMSCANQEKQIITPIYQNNTPKVVGDYLNQEDLMDAPYILEGTVEKISDSFDYGGIKFVEITFTIEDTLYAKDELGKNVTILREKELFAPLEENHQYILYLYDYEGSIATNVKMVCGGDLGAYEIVSADENETGKKLSEYKQEIQNDLKQ